MIRVASLICLVWSSQGWFWVGNSTRSLPERGPWQTWARESFPNLSDSLDSLGDRWETLQPMGWTFEVPSWDQVLWTIGDTLIGSFGWIFFGNAWGDVRSGLRRILQVGGILCLCLVAHYVWAVCYPAVSLLVGIVLTVVWVLRAILKLAGKILFYAQKLAGGAPEAVDVGYIGPSTGKAPETSELRQFKPTGSATKLVAVKRNGSVAVFQVGTEVPSIRSHGIYLPVGTGYYTGQCRVGSTSSRPRSSTSLQERNLHGGGRSTLYYLRGGEEARSGTISISNCRRGCEGGWPYHVELVDGIWCKGSTTGHKGS